jgi:hypothetical protein
MAEKNFLEAAENGLALLAADRLEKCLVRVDSGLLVYALGDVDVCSRNPGTPERYTVLIDCEECGWKQGDVKALAKPYDLQMGHTLRDMSKHL